MSLFRHSLFAACLMMLCTTAFSAPPTAPKKRGFDAYPLVQTRNIFDSDRKPGVSSASGPVQPPAAAAPSSSDFAALNGTMIMAEKSLAFFSGSRPEFNKVLTAGSVIAGAKLIKITPDSVEIEREGKRTAVQVGKTVPLNASSTSTEAPTTTTPSNSSPSPTDTSASSAPSSGSDREAVMRRMMEKRQQELK